MKISIITVVYNCVNTFEQTLLSVINQDFKNFEFIIVDGGSTDGTLGLVKKYQDRITKWISEPDNGIYDAMNKGISMASGDYVYFIGGDDILYDNNVLSKVSSWLKNNKHIYYGNVLFKKRSILYDGKFNKIKIVTRNISHQSIFYPIEIFHNYKYNINYKIYADYELNLKLFNSRYFNFQYMPLTIAVFNDEGLSGTNTLDIEFEKDRLRIIKYNFPYWIYIYRFLRSKISKIVS